METGSSGANQDGSRVVLQEAPSRERANRANCSRGTSGKSGEAAGSRLQCRTPAIGDIARPHGEVSQSRQSRCPDGTGKRCRMRGGLMGLSPEALCGEAPKGQPVTAEKTSLQSVWMTRKVIR